MISYDYDTMSTPAFLDADAPSRTRALHNRQEWLDSKGRRAGDSCPPSPFPASS